MDDNRNVNRILRYGDWLKSNDIYVDRPLLKKQEVKDALKLKGATKNSGMDEIGSVNPEGEIVAKNLEEEGENRENQDEN
jgi:hypothetical protein